MIDVETPVAREAVDVVPADVSDLVFAEAFVVVGARIPLRESDEL